MERPFCWPKLSCGSRGPSTPQNDSLRDSFCSAQDDRSNVQRSFASLRMTGVGLALLAVLVTSAWAAGPALTTIQDTIYRADGTPAAGTVLISWPSFTSAEGDPVAAGSRDE